MYNTEVNFTFVLKVNNLKIYLTLFEFRKLSTYVYTSLYDLVYKNLVH